MKNYVVTISRQFAAMGRSVAQAMSDELDIAFYDRDIVEATAARMGLPVSEISDREDNHSRYFRSLYPLGTGMLSVQDELFQTQRNIIRDLAEKESCIIVGRCADVVLADKKNVLNIRVIAPYDARLKNCVEKLGMDEKTAKKMIERIDRSREQYHKEYGGCELTKYTDIMINTARYGIEGAAEQLCSIVRQRFEL
ncbi:MAG: cytidylate kinase-like family protein [Bacteroidaceae bacterium]|nr:cytidylate kinase-like family protein [Bacteroidaceae bacterium]MCQ2501882.1 cytidylate kinase-like family protein [Lachnospiraceae bacterium]